MGSTPVSIQDRPRSTPKTLGDLMFVFFMLLLERSVVDCVQSGVRFVM